MGQASILDTPGIALQTGAARIELSLEAVSDDLGDGVFMLNVIPSSTEISFGPASRVRLLRSDVLRLRGYIDDHLKILARSSPTAMRSEGFAPVDLDFTLRLLDGEFEGGFGGYCTITFLVKRRLPEGENAYFGFEGTVDISELEKLSLKLGQLESLLRANP